MTEDDAADRSPADARCPDSTATLENYGGTPCGRGPDGAAAGGFRDGPATPRSSNSASRSEPTRCAAPPTHSGSTHRPRRSRCRSSSPRSARSPTPPPSGCRASVRRTSRVTPLQNAMVAATIANDGVSMQPYLVDSLEGPDLANISSTAPQEQRRAVSAQVAAKLTDLMVGAERVHPAGRGDSRRADRLQDRDRRARYRSPEHPAACVVHRVRPGAEPQGRGRRAGRERRRPAVGHRRCAGRTDRTGNDGGGTAGGRDERPAAEHSEASDEPPRGSHAVRAVSAAAADRDRRYGPGLGGGRQPARPPGRRQGAQGRSSPPTRSSSNGSAPRPAPSPCSITPVSRPSTTTAKQIWTARVAPRTW